MLLNHNNHFLFAQEQHNSKTVIYRDR